MKHDRCAVARDERSESQDCAAPRCRSRGSRRSPRATIAIGVAALAACALSWSSLVYGDTTLPAFAAVKASYLSSEAILLDRHGVPLAEMRIDPKVRRLEWVSLADVSPIMAGDFAT